MMKIVLALALTNAFGFQSQANIRSKTVSAQAKPFENELGAQAPLGLFDPLGIIADGDQERFDRLRYIELKHGRIAQLAVLGQIVTKAGIHFPGYIDRANTVKFADIPTGFAGLSKIPVGGYIQIALFIFALEIGVMGAPLNGASEPEFIGDFRNGTPDFGWDKFSDEVKLRKRAIELNQGRAAMMGISALMVHELIGVSIWPGGI
eukprot:CAMPEP_0197349262 /NCGR_PEP_ID=MMETSP0893-20130614/9392_1 /TAXON_ID=44058 ORGANISM="Aureoumbra lagunensis, Strain CCMP1510" /NCGR_SAMPLE_ID=MMETSP0893 /ASSEMBLY_ACC=CAM_ASM_000539 /LENGTH=205 /DNA_ID=CAMNT_0042860417 /DNA_START=64 /DNA_END=681 /DNA_ORIENTATION=+